MSTIIAKAHLAGKNVGAGGNAFDGDDFVFVSRLAVGLAPSGNSRRNLATVPVLPCSCRHRILYRPHVDVTVAWPACGRSAELDLSAEFDVFGARFWLITL